MADSCKRLKTEEATQGEEDRAGRAGSGCSQQHGESDKDVQSNDDLSNDEFMDRYINNVERYNKDETDLKCVIHKSTKGVPRWRSRSPDGWLCMQS